MILLNYMVQTYIHVILIKGFAGNKNITAASIAFKIPFLLYLLIAVKNNGLYFFNDNIVLCIINIYH